MAGSTSLLLPLRHSSLGKSTLTPCQAYILSFSTCSDILFMVIFFTHHSIGTTFLHCLDSQRITQEHHEKMRTEPSEKFYGAVLPCSIDTSRSIKRTRTTRPPQAQKLRKPAMSYYHKPEAYKSAMPLTSLCHLHSLPIHLTT
jgi:hypothetical protein